MRPQVFLLGLLCSCSPSLEKFSFEAPKMGSVFRISIFAEDSLAARTAADSAFARIDEINLALSDYAEESETWQLNASSPADWTAVSDDLLQTLLISKEIAEQTGGAFDPAVGNLVQIWRRARRRQELPRETAVQEALQKSGIGHLEIDAGGRRLRFRQSGVRLDFGGIGKGYAADEARKVLKTAGFPFSMVSAESSIAAGDVPKGKEAWEFLMTNGPAGEGLAELIRCSNCHLASSGDLYQYMAVDGRHYSHIVDPATGMALTNGAFAIVIAPSATLADAYATAFCVMGPEEIAQLFTQQTNIHAKAWKTAGDSTWVWQSVGFADYLVRNKPRQ